MKDNRKPGWDKQAVNRIAKEEYGSLVKMFEAHGWNTEGRVISQIAPTRVVETYGNIGAFVRAHENGLAGNNLLNPMAAIQADSPNVWLTSYYGYDPKNWGLLAFGSESDRDRFVNLSEPGALVVIYGTKGLATDEAGKVLGVQQISHTVGPSKQFMSPRAWKQKKNLPENKDRWNFGVRCTRAWYIVPEQRPDIEEFAGETYSVSAARAIGRYCKQMSASEAKKILDLDMYEVSVFGGKIIGEAQIGTGSEVLKPSKPGPVSQNGFMSSESEGPKHLYILELDGNADAFLASPAEGRKIVKVGFSKSPETRQDFFNKALPGDKMNWRLRRSTFKDRRNPFPTSSHAKAGEQKMVRFLHKNEHSLGGEFFLASDEYIEAAWKKGIKAAEEYKK